MINISPLDIKIIFEDNHIIVIEKPFNIPTQEDNTGDKDIVNLLKENIKIRYKKPGNVYVGLVHRLDRPVGGLMVFAKTSKAASRLSEQIRKGTFQKFYLAIVNGILSESEGRLQNYLLKNTKDNIVSVVEKGVEGAKEAVLDYTVVSKQNDKSLVFIELHTGRSHQIRVQFSNIGHPLVGDQKYGVGINKKNQQICLWSNIIKFNHPTLKEKVEFKSIPPIFSEWSHFRETLT